MNLSWNKLPVDEQSIGWLEHLREQGAGWVAIASDRDDFWIDRPNLRAYLKKTAEFKVKTDDYIIYRLLSPAELAAAAKK